jgi:hypothetical protein
LHSFHCQMELTVTNGFHARLMQVDAQSIADD